MTKTELLGAYRTSLNTCSLAYASIVLWAYPDTSAFFEKLLAKMHIPNPHPELLPMLRDEASFKIATEELYNAVHRAALKELFELTQAYCKASSQFTALRDQSWFNFWRVLRNCFSHDMHFHFNAHDRSILPTKWSGVTVDLSLEGMPLTHGRMSREKVRELLETGHRYVETLA